MNTENQAATPDAEQARRIVLLWQQPILADAEIPAAAKTAPSLWATCKAGGDTPPALHDRQAALLPHRGPPRLARG